MKVALYEKPHSLKVAQKSLRALNAGEYLVRVTACGVCGTDVHIVEGQSRSRPPVVLGHEFTGIVEDAGPGISSQISPGDHVAVDPNIACGTCSYCRRGLVHLCSGLRALGVDIDGGMAEYCIVPEKQVYSIPPEIPSDVAAFIEPVSCCVHGIDKAGIRPGDSVVILGGGTIGLIMLQLARVSGAAKIILVEPLEHKRLIALELRADHILDPRSADILKAVTDLTTTGADVVIECAGRPDTASTALKLARRGGLVEFFGVCPIGVSIPLEPNAVYVNELTIVGSYVNPLTFSRAIALLQSGRVRVDAFTLHRFPLDGVHEALRYQRDGLTIKSILTPQA